MGGKRTWAAPAPPLKSAISPKAMPQRIREPAEKALKKLSGQARFGLCFRPNRQSFPAAKTSFIAGRLGAGPGEKIQVQRWDRGKARSSAPGQRESPRFSAGTEGKLAVQIWDRGKLAVQIWDRGRACGSAPGQGREQRLSAGIEESFRRDRGQFACGGRAFR